MNSEQLKQVLELHAAWLGNRAGGKRADLRGADLRSTYLRGANLYGANLRGADLYGANLRGADLYGADLYGADLRDVNIADVSNTPIKIARLDFGGWSVLVEATHTTIGCQKHSNQDWLKFTPKSVAGFAEGAEAWWKQHGAAVKAVIKDIQS